MTQTFAKCFVAAVMVVVLSSCSRTDNNPTPISSLAKEGGRLNHDSSNLYDPSTLMEIHSFDDLPEGIKKLANESYMKTMTDNQYPRFLAGGASESSAIVAVKLFGFVPTVFARAYVHSDAGWVPAKVWSNIGSVNDLHSLVAATSDAQ